jgi:hypothetical protein
MEKDMSYPLFDTGYTLWASDVESRLKDQLGQSLRGLGIEPKLLLQSYYGGLSVGSTLSLISSRYGLSF